MTQEAESSAHWDTFADVTTHDSYPFNGYIKKMGSPAYFQVVIPIIVALNSPDNEVMGRFTISFNTLEEAKTFFLKFKTAEKQFSCKTDYVKKG